MDHLVAEIIKAYGRINPQDLRDTEIHICTETYKRLAKQITKEGLRVPFSLPATIFGLTVRIDDALAADEFRLVTENEQDRAIRRATDAGRAVNIMRMEWPAPVIQPIPTPTLRALLKHWWKRIFSQ